jgi:hypothetical protein
VADDEAIEVPDDRRPAPLCHMALVRCAVAWRNRAGPRAVPMVSWREREACAEARLRDQNEWIDAISTRFGNALLTVFVCECGDPTCTETIELTHPEYDTVRAASTHFAIACDHENPESEAVISQCARYAVVGQTHGWGLRISRAADSRTSHSTPRRK